ncbi:MAG: hypothetical protein ABL921_12070 [Pirellula sp.]
MRDKLGSTCNYVCDGEFWILTGGTAPPGYYCEETMGLCEEPGDVGSNFPVPIPPGNPTPADPPSGPIPDGSALYRYEPKTDEFYFSSAGKSPEKHGFLGKVSMKELKTLFPKIGAEAEKRSTTRMGRGFSIHIPALPSGQLRQRKRS